MRGTGGETGWGALLRAWQRIRAVVQLTLVVALVGAPCPVFLTDSWSGPRDGQDLVAASYPIDAPASADVATPPDPARAAPLARALPPVPAAASAAKPAPVAATAPASSGRMVVASWYGPGLFGNRTACGQTLTPASWGLAHRSLPCGTVLSITYAGRTVSAPVIDRGPYIAGRELDLASAVASALGFSGVHPVLLSVP